MAVEWGMWGSWTTKFVGGEGMGIGVHGSVAGSEGRGELGIASGG
jgi:hypothetical protein